jgi:hypothetical protein
MDTAIAHRNTLKLSVAIMSIDAMCRDIRVIHFIHDCSAYFLHRKKNLLSKYKYKHIELMALEQA